MSRRKNIDGGVELNVAAMLDMAFQLLAFFILTFRPASVEGQFSLHLPPAQPMTNLDSTTLAGSNADSKDRAAGLNTLVISAAADKDGALGSLMVGEKVVDGLPGLNQALKGIFADPDMAFDQVIVQADAALHYEDLMRVTAVCAEQKLRNGKLLSRLSFVEIPSATAPKE